MQVTGATSAPVTFRNPLSDAPQRPEVDLGRNDANQRSAQQRSGNTQARADQVRVEQTQTVRAVEATSRAAEPEAPQSVGDGGFGNVRGSQLDITV